VIVTIILGSPCSYIAEHDIVCYLQNVTDINCE